MVTWITSDVPVCLFTRLAPFPASANKSLRTSVGFLSLKQLVTFLGWCLLLIAATAEVIRYEEPFEMNGYLRHKQGRDEISLMIYTAGENSNQLVHPHSLVNAFAV